MSAMLVGFWEPKEHQDPETDNVVTEKSQTATTRWTHHVER